MDKIRRFKERIGAEKAIVFGSFAGGVRRARISICCW